MEIEKIEDTDDGDLVALANSAGASGGPFKTQEPSLKGDVCFPAGSTLSDVLKAFEETDD